MPSRFDLNNPKDREKKTEVIARLEKILVEGDRTLLPEMLAALARLEGLHVIEVFQKIQDKAKITEQRKKEIAEALGQAEHIRSSQPGGGF